jgi:hypothetical protein
MNTPISEQFKTSRYGYFDDDLIFHEVKMDDATLDHPFASRLRWVGGPNDYLLAQAVEKAAYEATKK